MSKALYVGIGSKARKVKNIYVGIISGRARKVKKVYVGIGNAARNSFGAEVSLTYYSSITTSHNRGQHGFSLPSYAIFACDDYEEKMKIVEAYNSSLTKSIPAELSLEKAPDTNTGVVGSYAVIGSGHRYNSNTGYATGDAYNNSLTRTNITCSSSKYMSGCATVGNTLIFCGEGQINGSSNLYHYGYRGVTCINSSLVASSLSAITNPTCDMDGASNSEYAVFLGGVHNKSISASTEYRTTVYYYNISLVRSSRTGSSGWGRVGISTDMYAVFGGGLTSGSALYKNTVTVYNTSMTGVNAPTLNWMKYNAGGIGLNDGFVIAGGCGRENDNSSRISMCTDIEVYNNSLVKTKENSFPSTIGEFSCKLATAKVGNKVLFGGYGNGYAYIM